MKLKTKLILSIMIMIALILSISRYFIVRQNFKHLIENSARQNTNGHILEKYLLENNIVKHIQKGEELSNEKLSEYVKEISSYKTNELDKILIYSEAKDEIYSNFNQEIQISQFEKDEVDHYYIKKIGNAYYMTFLSCWDINNEKKYMVNAYDITAIFEQRDMQANEILATDIIILILSAIFTWIVSSLLTAPIEELNQMSKQIASGKFNQRVEIKSKDEIGQLANNFNIMAQQIENKIKQKDDFVSGFSHELKTPMTAIIGYADLLRIKKCDEKVSKTAVNYIYSETKRLEALSSKLMQLMEISQNQITLENIQIVDVINKVIKAQKVMLESTQIITKIEKATVKADSDLLQVVLRNLIENAKKAEPRSNQIIVKGEKIQESKYRISVIDDGRGIPKEHLDKVTRKLLCSR